MSSPHNLNYRNTSKQECIYGWYPSICSDMRNETPKEIYANLGSRPPKLEKYCEADILYNYHQSIKPSELIYRPKQSVEEALKPPWSLNIKTNKELEENAEKTIPEAFAVKRSQSAPILKQAPTHRIILKIPTPQLQNLFDNEAEEYFDTINNKESFLNSNSQSEIDNNTNKSLLNINDLIPVEQQKLFNLNQASDIIITNSTSNIDQNLIEDTKSIKENENDKVRVATANNYGKKPLIINEKPLQEETVKLILRPKTSTSVMRRSNSNASIKSNLKQRPKTSIHYNKPPSPGLQVDQSINEIKINNKHEDNSNNNNNLHNLINSHSTQEQQKVVQYHINHFSNNKNSQNLQKSVDPTVIYVDPTWVDNYLTTKTKLRKDIKVIDGHWKDQIINRSKYLQKRPSYFIKINMDKLKPDPPAPEIHYKASETFFYNTLPYKKATFNIDPNFISENLNVKKLELQNRPPSSNSNGPIRYRRDYAFAY